MKKALLSASILSADLTRLGEEVRGVLQAGVDFIHVDVMDNHYVPNLTFGPLICTALRKAGITAQLDVHLMVEPVDRLIKDFAKAGANFITFHPEASKHVDRSLQLIRDLGCKAGLAFNPSTPLNHLDYVLDKLDLILIMSVNPGFSQQKFLPSAVEKIKTAAQIISQRKLPILLAVDGGVKEENIAEIAKAGAQMFVMGSAIYNNHEDYTTTIQKIRARLEK